MTETSVIPAFLILSRSKEAPIAEEPIPASQAKMIFLIPEKSAGAKLVGVSFPFDSAFICAISCCLASNSSAVERSCFKMIAAMIKDTTAPATTPASTPR